MHLIQILCSWDVYSPIQFFSGQRVAGGALTPRPGDGSCPRPLERGRLWSRCESKRPPAQRGAESCAAMWGAPIPCRAGAPRSGVLGIGRTEEPHRAVLEPLFDILEQAVGGRDIGGNRAPLNGRIEAVGGFDAI